MFTEDAFAAGDLFLDELKAAAAGSPAASPGSRRLTESWSRSPAARRTLLTTNRNLLIIADILVVNRGFAEQHPDMVDGDRQEPARGQPLVRDQPDA